MPAKITYSMRNTNKSPKIPYSTMVREMEKWAGIRIRDRITTPPKVNHFYRVTPCHAYRVWSTSVTAIVSARRSTRQSDRTTVSQFWRSNYKHLRWNHTSRNASSPNWVAVPHEPSNSAGISDPTTQLPSFTSASPTVANDIILTQWAENTKTATTCIVVHLSTLQDISLEPLFGSLTHRQTNNNNNNNNRFV